jgi:hypothetical protein
MFEINSVVLTTYRLQVQKQIEQVKQNIYILGELIDWIKFCEAFDLALKEKTDSNNPSLGWWGNVCVPSLLIWSRAATAYTYPCIFNAYE